MKALTDMVLKINKKTVRDAARKKGIWCLAELARRIPCSTTSVYLAIERPSRYPRVFARIKELTGL